MKSYAVATADTAYLSTSLFGGGGSSLSGLYPGGTVFPDGGCRKLPGARPGLSAGTPGGRLSAAPVYRSHPFPLGSLLRPACAANSGHCLCGNQSLTGNGIPSALDTGGTARKCRKGHCAPAVRAADSGAFSGAGENPDCPPFSDLFRLHAAGSGELHVYFSARYQCTCQGYSDCLCSVRTHGISGRLHLSTADR